MVILRWTVHSMFESCFAKIDVVLQFSEWWLHTYIDGTRQCGSKWKLMLKMHYAKRCNASFSTFKRFCISLNCEIPRLNLEILIEFLTIFHVNVFFYKKIKRPLTLPRNHTKSRLHWNMIYFPLWNEFECRRKCFRQNRTKKKRKKKRSWNRHSKFSFQNLSKFVCTQRFPFYVDIFISFTVQTKFQWQKERNWFRFGFFFFFFFHFLVCNSFFWLCLRDSVYMNGKRDQSHQRQKAEHTIVLHKFVHVLRSRKTKSHSTIYMEKKYCSDKSGMEITPFPIRYSVVYTTHDTRTHTLKQPTRRLLPRNPFTEKFWMTSIWALRCMLPVFVSQNNDSNTFYAGNTNNVWIRSGNVRNVVEFSFYSNGSFLAFSKF